MRIILHNTVLLTVLIFLSVFVYSYISHEIRKFRDSANICGWMMPQRVALLPSFQSPNISETTEKFSVYTFISVWILVSSSIFKLFYATLNILMMMRKVLFLVPSVCGFVFVYEKSPEPLNGFLPNSQGRRVWFSAGMSLKVKVKGQRPRSPGTKTAENAVFVPGDLGL